MKFIYPAVFRPTEDKNTMLFSRILPAVKPTVTRWMMPSKMPMQLHTTGSTQSLWNLRESFLRFPMRAIWSFRKETLSAISL